MANPTLTSLVQPIFWTPQTDPAAIVLATGPTPSVGFCITVSDLEGHAQLRAGATHVLLRMNDERFDVELTETRPDAPLAALILLDEQTPDRLVALARFWAAANGKPIPADKRLTPQRQQRARQMLRVVDALATGNTYRSIAQTIFPQHRIDAASWVGSAVRETTIRLARDGMKLVRGGYRALLRRPRRER